MKDEVMKQSAIARRNSREMRKNMEEAARGSENLAYLPEASKKSSDSDWSLDSESKIILRGVFTDDIAGSSKPLNGGEIERPKLTREKPSFKKTVLKTVNDYPNEDRRPRLRQLAADFADAVFIGTK